MEIQDVRQAPPASGNAGMRATWMLREVGPVIPALSPPSLACHLQLPPPFRYPLPPSIAVRRENHVYWFLSDL